MICARLPCGRRRLGWWRATPTACARLGRLCPPVRAADGRTPERRRRAGGAGARLGEFLDEVRTGDKASFAPLTLGPGRASGAYPGLGFCAAPGQPRRRQHRAALAPTARPATRAGPGCKPSCRRCRPAACCARPHSRVAGCAARNPTAPTRENQNHVTSDLPRPARPADLSIHRPGAGTRGRPGALLRPARHPRRKHAGHHDPVADVVRASGVRPRPARARDRAGIHQPALGKGPGGSTGAHLRAGRLRGGGNARHHRHRTVFDQPDAPRRIPGTDWTPKPNTARPRRWTWGCRSCCSPTRPRTTGAWASPTWPATPAAGAQDRRPELERLPIRSPWPHLRAITLLHALPGAGQPAAVLMVVPSAVRPWASPPGSIRARGRRHGDLPFRRQHRCTTSRKFAELAPVLGGPDQVRQGPGFQPADEVLRAINNPIGLQMLVHYDLYMWRNHIRAPFLVALAPTTSSSPWHAQQHAQRDEGRPGAFWPSTTCAQLGVDQAPGGLAHGWRTVSWDAPSGHRRAPTPMARSWWCRRASKPRPAPSR